MKKRILAIFLALLSILSTLSLASADDSAETPLRISSNPTAASETAEAAASETGTSETEATETSETETSETETSEPADETSETSEAEATEEIVETIVSTDETGATDETDETGETTSSTAPGVIEGDGGDTAPTESIITTETTTETTPTASPTLVAWASNSSWFDAELAEANALGLIPTRFAGADLRTTMSRAEFAAVAALVFKAMGGSASAPALSPFSDTSDADVLYAYAAQIVNGYDGGTFKPNDPVSRQETATMLTRVFKAIYWPLWTLAGDASYSAHGLDYSGVALYVDDGAIDDYAFPSVYFLTKYGVAKGIGNNRFDPDRGCTREEGIALALRLYKAFR